MPGANRAKARETKTPDPSKADQYQRWRGLKQMQDEYDKKAAAKN